MHHHSATQNKNKNPVSPAGDPSRSIAHRSDGDRARTIGFPALQKDRPKKVWFDPPRPAICMIDGGAEGTHCLVLNIWEGGARLRIQDPSVLTEFDLLFATGPRPVTRRCKRLQVHGDLVDVAFRRTAPCYVIGEHADQANDPASSKAIAERADT